MEAPNLGRLMAMIVTNVEVLLPEHEARRRALLILTALLEGSV